MLHMGEVCCKLLVMTNKTSPTFGIACVKGGLVCMQGLPQHQVLSLILCFPALCIFSMFVYQNDSRQYRLLSSLCLCVVTEKYPHKQPQLPLHTDAVFSDLVLIVIFQTIFFFKLNRSSQETRDTNSLRLQHRKTRNLPALISFRRPAWYYSTHNVKTQSLLFGIAPRPVQTRNLWLGRWTRKKPKVEKCAKRKNFHHQW